MGKKYIGYGDFFCWNCGKRIENRSKKCPHCGAYYKMPLKIIHPPKKKIHTSGSIINFGFFKTAFQYLLGMGFYALIIIGIITAEFYYDGTYWYEYEYVIKGVMGIVWGFWIFWLIYKMIADMKTRAATKAANRVNPQYNVCATCGTSCAKGDNYCARCGQVILK